MSQSKATKILYVEDDPATARLFQKTLTPLGYEVDLAADGEEGLLKWLAGSYDILATDHDMPKMKGLDLIREVASRGPLPPTVMIAGHGNETIAVQAMKLGADDYIMKDSEGRYLKLVPQTIEDTLAKRRLREEKLKAEEALRENETKFRNLFDNAEVGMFRTRLDGSEILDMNGKFLKIFGRTREEMRGSPSVNHWADPHEREEIVRRLETDGRVTDFECKMLNKQGEVRICATSLRLYRELGVVEGSIMDITDRKKAEELLRESEEQFRILVESAPDAVFVQTGGSFAYLNGAALQLFGADSHEDLLGTPVFDRLHPSFHGLIRERIRLLNVEKKKVPPLEQKYLRMDNSQVDVSVSASPIYFRGQDGAIVFPRDIGDRKLAEEFLRQRNEFLTTVLESLTHPFYVINADSYLIELANASALSSGVSASSTCYGATHGRETPCNDSAHPCPLAEVKRTGKPARVEHVHYDEEGKMRNIEVHAYPVLDDTGKVVQIIEYCLDVTDLKQFENVVREQERMLSTILETSPSGICYFIEGKTLWWNKAMRELFGYDEDESEKIERTDVLEFCESRAEYERVRKIFRAQAAEGRRLETEARFRRKDGSIFTGNVSAGSSEPASYLAGTTVIIRDITTRKAIEEECLHLVAAIEQADESIIVTDVAGSIQYVNPTFERVTGYSAQEVLGQTPGILKSGQHDEEFYRDLWGTLTRGDIWRGHFVNKKKDGTHFEEDATISPVRNESGSIISYVAVKRDVTDRAILEKQLRQAQKMEAVGTLAGGIAHDFNNLLQVILGYTDMLVMEEGAQSRELGKLETIRKAAKDGGELVKGLLTFSRQVESSLRPCDLNLELKRISRILGRTIPKMIEIKLILGDDVKTVNADPVQFEQVILNLCVNAQHAMPGSGTLTIETDSVNIDEGYCRTHVDVKPGDYVLLRISDTGHGMDQEVQEHIFEPFYTTKEMGEGTGLGLAIVYGIVKNHGGHITCHSEPGQGSAFNIYFPAFGREAGLGTTIAWPEMHASGTESILVVDDDERIRNMVAKILTRTGYTVLTAENGYQALALYRKRKDSIDLVILDLLMPEMGGEQCLDEILNVDPRARVLIASGYAIHAATREDVESRSCGVIKKPFDLMDLLRVVRRILDDSGGRGRRVGSSGQVSVPSDEGKRTSLGAMSVPAEALSEHEAPDIPEFPWRLRILVIDDREPFLTMIEVGLTQFRQTPFSASSSPEGIQMFRDTTVDVVICDLTMPELNGWEVGKKIKEICREKGIPKTPFILLTGQSDIQDIDQEERDRMADCGVDAIVGKPVDIPELLRVAGRVINETVDRAE